MTQATLNNTRTTAAKGLVCKECKEEYPLQATHICELCFGPLEVQYDYDYLRTKVTRESIKAGPHSIWRYKDLLPVPDEHIVDVGTGMTPLLKANRLARRLGLKNLYKLAENLYCDGVGRNLIKIIQTMMHQISTTDLPQVPVGNPRLRTRCTDDGHGNPCGGGYSLVSPAELTTPMKKYLDGCSSNDGGMPYWV